MDYSRFNFVIMCLQLYIYAVGLELTGLRIYDLEFKSQVFGLDYVYFCGLNGLFLGLGVYRLLEIYWYAKDVNYSLNTVTNEEVL